MSSLSALPVGPVGRPAVGFSFFFAQITEREKEVKRLEEDLNTLRSKYETLNEKCKKLQQEAEALERDKTRLERDINGLREQLANVEQDKVHLEQKLKEQAKTLQDLMRENEESKEALNKLARTNKQQDTKIKQLEADIDVMKMKEATQEGRIADLEEQLAAMDERLRSLTNQMKLMNSDNKNLRLQTAEQEQIIQEEMEANQRLLLREAALRVQNGILRAVFPSRATYNVSSLKQLVDWIYNPRVYTDADEEFLEAEKKERASVKDAFEKLKRDIGMKDAHLWFVHNAKKVALQDAHPELPSHAELKKIAETVYPKQPNAVKMIDLFEGLGRPSL